MGRPPYRVFFDTNEGCHKHGYWLGLDRSKRDLEAIGTDLREGLLVTIYMSDDLEMEATLRLGGDRFNPALDVQEWWADPVPNTVRDFHQTAPQR